MLSGTGLCDELITRPEESYRLCCFVVCDLETARMGAPYIYIYIYIYIYDISCLRVKYKTENTFTQKQELRSRDTDVRVYNPPTASTIYGSGGGKNEPTK